MTGRAGQPDRFLATILFTDISGSTDLAVQLGDRGWRRLLAEHNKVVRRRLREFGGRELDTAGDGFFCSFEQPAQAVRAADAILRDAAALGLRVRAGIHTGECERVGTKVGGVAVHIAARVMATAAPGSVLVSSTVRDLVAGSQLDLAPGGTHALKGVPGEWTLYQLVRPTDEMADPGSVVGAMAAEAAPRQRRRAAIVVAVGAIAIAVVGVVASAGNFFGPPPSRAALTVGIDGLGTVNGATGEINAVQQVPEGPASLAIGQGRIWLGSVSRSVVSGLPLSGAAPGFTIGAVGRPSSMAVGDAKVWVADPYAQTISVVDAGNGDVLRTVEQAVRQVAYGLGSAWAVDDLRDVVLRLDRDAQVQASIDLPAGSLPTTIALGPDAVWVGNAGTNSVTRIDPSTLSITAGAIPLRVVPSAIATAGGDVWVASRESDALLRLDPGTNAVAMTIEEACDQPTAVLAVEGGVWLGCAGTRQLLHLDREGEILSTTQLGGEATALARDPDTNLIYVTVRAP
jgi:class 3 adenylate cyclase